MRQAFIQTLIDLAATDDRVLLLTGDLGYMVMEPFIERFPSRFLNVGVAEQNMIGVATGLLRPVSAHMLTPSLHSLHFVHLNSFEMAPFSIGCQCVS